MKTALSKRQMFLSALLCLPLLGGNSWASPESPESQKRKPVLAGLEEILAHGEEHSPLLLAKEKALLLGEAQKEYSERLLLEDPEFSFALGPRMSGKDMGLDVELSLMQPFSVSGEKSGQKAQAKAYQALLLAEYKSASWALHCEIHKAYNEVLLLEKRAGLAESLVAFQEEVLGVAKERVRAGESSPLELRLAETEFAQAKEAWLKEKAKAFQEKLSLASLSGAKEGSYWEPKGPLQTLSLPPGEEALWEKAKAQLPRFREMERAIEEKEMALRLEEKRAWPKLYAGLQYEREASLGVEKEMHVLKAAFSMDLPFSKGRHEGTLKARAELEMAKAKRHEEKALLKKDIAAAREQLVAAYQRNEVFGQEILPQWEENLSLLKRSFELGEIDILGLFVGRERFYKIQADALDALSDYYNALGELERVLGIDLFEKEGEGP